MSLSVTGEDLSGGGLLRSRLKKLQRGSQKKYLKNSGKWSFFQKDQKAFEKIGRHARHQVEEPEGLHLPLSKPLVRKRRGRKSVPVEPAQLKHKKSALEEYIDSLDECLCPERKGISQSPSMKTSPGD